MRATIPAVQVRGECSCGAGRGSLSARLGPHGWPEKLRLGQEESLVRADAVNEEDPERDEEEEEEVFRDAMSQHEDTDAKNVAKDR